MRKSESGFTIVELLIVIVVIAILATISIVAYNGIQTRARATAIVSDLKATEKALNAYKIASGASTWWVDDDPALTGSINPTISTLISTHAEFRSFLQTAPTTNGLTASGEWFYDNDNDIYNGCSAGVSGVNIAIVASATTSIAQAVDNVIDDGDLACGRFRAAGGFLLYAIANRS